MHDERGVWQVSRKGVSTEDKVLVASRVELESYEH